MTKFEEKKLDIAFERFVKRHFDLPGRCNNVDQVRFYVAELSQKIEELKERFNYVPDRAYILLSKYNRIQNAMIYSDFKNA